MQGRLEPIEVADFLVEAFGLGVTWWDTSDDYGSHPHVREALRRLPRSRIQITTKSHAVGATPLRASLQASLREMGVDYVDVFLLHEIDSLDDLKQRTESSGALAALRAEGLIRAGGLSTHNIDVLEAAAGDPRFDVLLTNYNVAGVHMDASHADYGAALQRACRAGQGTAVMKTLGEGVLVDRYDEALAHNFGLEFAHGVLVGIRSTAEMRQACAAWRRFQSDLEIGRVVVDVAKGR